MNHLNPEETGATPGGFVLPSRACAGAKAKQTDRISACREATCGCKSKVGLLGGSFDPVHEGHVALARRALEDCALDEVWFVPAAQSPFKPGATHFTDEERVARLRAAIADEPRFKVCLEDLERGGVSYTCELMEHMIAAHPECEFTFVVGADSLASLHRWHRATDLVKLCRIVSYGRRGSEIKRDGLGFDPETNARLFADYHPDFDVPVSSTEIRKRIS